MDDATLTTTTSAATPGTVSRTVNYRRRTRAVRKEGKGQSRRGVETRRANTRTKHTMPSVATAGATAGDNNVTRRPRSNMVQGEYSSIVFPTGRGMSDRANTNTVAARAVKVRPRSRAGRPAGAGRPDPPTVGLSRDRPQPRTGRPRKVDRSNTTTDSNLDLHQPAVRANLNQHEPAVRDGARVVDGKFSSSGPRRPPVPPAG